VIIELGEMSDAETIEGPIGPTSRSLFGERLCWLVAAATLHGPRINASLAMPGLDSIRLGNDGIRRPDLRGQLTTDDGELILLRYDVAVIRPTQAFVDALASGGGPRSSAISTFGSLRSSRWARGATRGLPRACSWGWVG